MKMIGITGGVGAGKSSVLDHLEKKPDVVVRKADEIAHSLMRKGEEVYFKLVELLGEEVLSPDGEIDRRKMAERIFSDAALTDKVNAIVHPAVSGYVEKDRAEKGSDGRYKIYFLEAALLIECGYDRICDELWYIYADPVVRRKRLKDSRGYSDEKTTAIMDKQLDDDSFRRNCSRIIDNSGNLKETLKEVDRIISGYTG